MVSKLQLLNTVRSYCLECCGNSLDLVEQCQASPNTTKGMPCAVWKYRMGNGRTYPNLTVSQIIDKIHEHCLECCDNSIEEIKNCSARPNSDPYYSCPLWNYRMGNRREKDLVKAL